METYHPKKIKNRYKSYTTKEKIDNFLSLIIYMDEMVAVFSRCCLSFIILKQWDLENVLRTAKVGCQLREVNALWTDFLSSNWLLLLYYFVCQFFFFKSTQDTAIRARSVIVIGRK